MICYQRFYSFMIYFFFLTYDFIILFKRCVYCTLLFFICLHFCTLVYSFRFVSFIWLYCNYLCVRVSTRHVPTRARHISARGFSFTQTPRSVYRFVSQLLSLNDDRVMLYFTYATVYLNWRPICRINISDVYINILLYRWLVFCIWFFTLVCAYYLLTYT